MTDPNKPPGSPEDFGRMRAEERELRQVKAGTLENAEAEFQAEQRRIQSQTERLKSEREKLERARQKSPTANIKHLLVAKKPNPAGGPSKFSVVGFYSSPAALAEGLAGAVMVYADAGQTLGAVEFDLSIKLDQPATPPL